MSNTIMATPPGRPVWGIGGPSPLLHFPPQWIEVDAKLARAAAPNQIGPANLAELVREFESGKTVDLAAGRSLRIGTSFGLIVNGRPVFGQFDEGHKTRAGMITTAAGIFMRGNPYLSAWEELCQEHIPRNETTVGLWQMSGMPLLMERSELYADTHGLRFDPNMTFEVAPVSSSKHVTVLFGDTPYRALGAWEPDTSSFEFIVTGETRMPKGWYVVDGEILDFLPHKPFRGTQVVTKNYRMYKQTTKAKIVIAAWKAGFRSV